jgi:hypothetical protein
VTISARVTAFVIQRAGDRCEYCHIEGWELQVDHIAPRSPRRRISSAPSAQDLDNPDNLAAACGHCNRFKGDFATGYDPLTGAELRLFDPRHDAWEVHFDWSIDYSRILPLTPMGAATIARLRMNAPELRRQRQLLRQAMAGGAAPWP